MPKVEDVKRIRVTPLTQDSSRTSEKSQEEEEAAKGSTRNATSSSSSSQSKVPPSSSSKSTADTRQSEEHEEEPRNPWRTNLRKTNSKLSLLEWASAFSLHSFPFCLKERLIKRAYIWVSAAVWHSSSSYLSHVNYTIVHSCSTYHVYSVMELFSCVSYPSPNC